VTHDVGRLPVDWIPAPRHEPRVKWQRIGIDAEPRTAYRTDAAGNLLVVPKPYARGGFDLLREDERSVGDLFGHMSDVRDADQFMIKMRYRL
jgi:hypothetical protein